MAAIQIRNTRPHNWLNWNPKAVKGAPQLKSVKRRKST